MMSRQRPESFRIAVGGFALESVSFLTQETGIEDFEREARRGTALTEGSRGSATVAGGFLDVLAEANAEAVPLVYSDCSAAGPASDAAFEAFRDELLQRLGAALPLNGVLLFLHGAMTTPTRSDPEGDLLESIRASFGPDLPVMAAFDLHANLSPRTAALCDGVFGFHFSPHVDMAETGQRAARALLAKLTGAQDPQLALVKVPLVLPSVFTATALAPLSDIVEESLSLPKRVPGIIDASVFCGFAYADTPDLGFSVAVIADGDTGLAKREAENLAERIWKNRTALLHEKLVFGLEEGLAEAWRIAADSDRPVVLLEHADRLNDSTWCLRRLIEGAPGLPEFKVHCPYLWDPVTAAAAMSSGASRRLDVRLGGRSSLRSGGPIAVEAEVLWAGEKAFNGTGPMRKGRGIDLGPAALLRIGDVTVSVTSNSTTAIDLDALEQFGIDIAAQDILLLRSKTHFRAVFEPLAAAVVVVDTPDWGTAELARLPYRHVRAGVFPLDPEAGWSRPETERATQEKQAHQGEQR